MAAYDPILAFLFSPVFMLILALSAIILSIAALLIARHAVKKTTFTPITSVKPPKLKPKKEKKEEAKREEKAEEQVKKEEAVFPEVAAPGAEGASPSRESEFSIQPSEEGGEFSSLEEFAQMIGMRSILLFNIMGMPIESYNVEDESRIAASTADFISTIRGLGSDFGYLTIEDDQRTILVSVGKVGDMEVFALAIGEPESALGAEEVRDLLRMYISGLMRRTK